MIVDAILSLVSLLLDGLAAVLPVDTLDLPDGSTIGASFSTYAGPANRFLPIAEALTFLTLLVNLWLPIALAYSVTFWIYRHLPLFGKG